MRQRLALFLPVLLLGNFAFADELTVDDDQPADHATIQGAIDAAQDGDVVLVRPGQYSGFVVSAKALTIVGRDASVQGSVVVSGLQASQTVVLSGMDITAAASHDALTVTASQGPVHLQDLQLLGGASGYDAYYDQYYDPGVGAAITGCERIVFTGCTIEGGKDWGDHYGGFEGGAGLASSGSKLSLYRCALKGGVGGRGWSLPGGRGGDACRPVGAPDESFFAAETSFQGGRGGDAEDMTDCPSDPPGSPGGDGGHGLVASVPIHELHCTFVGGKGGHGSMDYCEATKYDDGADGAPIHNPGGVSITHYSGSAPDLEALPSAGAGIPTTIVVEGTPGDAIVLEWDAQADRTFDSTLRGVWWPRVPASASHLLGTVPSSGTLETLVDLDLGGVTQAQPVFAQVVAIDIVGQQTLGTPRTILLTPTPYQRYCVAAPNSVGAGALLEMTGEASVTANRFGLRASAAPPKQFGFAFYGAQQQQLPLGDGFLCIGGQLFRFVPPVKSSGGGVFDVSVDLTAPPASGGPGWIAEGLTWNFQLWYRDPAAGGAGSNLTDALAVTFRP